MGFQQPLDLQTLGQHIFDEPVSRAARGAAGGEIVIQYTVDDGAGRGPRVADDMAGGEGLRIKKGRDLGALMRIKQRCCGEVCCLLEIVVRGR